MEDESDYYVPLFQEIKGIGPEFLKKILSSFGNCKQALTAPIEEFRNLTKNEGIIESISKLRMDPASIETRVQKFKNELNNKQVHYITFNSKSFPPRLRDIKSPPMGIYVKGTLNIDDLEKSIAIVGTRDPSIHGHSKARKIANELASNGFTIVSGLARGIDLESHLGALEVGGKTIAVLASGVCNIYPEEHDEVSRDIIRHGALVSETGITNKATQYDLVNRNRITSGLARGTLVIEGDLDSGTRHCANFTKEQGKPIFALKPSEPNRVVAQLPLDLIKNSNAIAIENGREILESLMVKDSDSIVRTVNPESLGMIKRDMFRFLDWNSIRKTEPVPGDPNLKDKVASYFEQNNALDTEIRKNQMGEYAILIREYEGLRNIEVILRDDGIYLDNNNLRDRQNILEVLMKLLIKAIEKGKKTTKKNSPTLLDFSRVE